MKSELSDIRPGSGRIWSPYVRRAWLFDSIVVSLLIGMLGSVYMNFALQQTVIIEPTSFGEQLLLFLLFFVPMLSYGLVVLAPLNGWIRSRIRRVVLQFLLFNIAALLLTRIIMSALPLPDALESPIVLWCIPIFSTISYLYSSLFLSQTQAAV